jgi:LPS-assembly lipoprotein
MRIARAVLLSLLASALGGCGFQPLYGDGGRQVGPMLRSIYVEPVSERVGYELRNDLLDLFNGTGRAEDAAYRLKLSLTEREEGVVLQPNTAITRYNYSVVAHYELFAKGGTDAVKVGDVTALTAYNVASAPFLYATVTAQRDARNRAANQIAERIRTELAVYLRSSQQRAASAQP